MSRVVYQMRQCGCLVMSVCLRSNGVAFNSFVKALYGACCTSVVVLRCGKQVSVEQQGYRQNRFYLAKLRAMVRKLPGFFFSSYRSLAASSALVRRRWFGVGVGVA